MNERAKTMSDKMPYYAIDKVAATISLDAKARVKWENRVDSDKRMEDIRERVQWMIDRLDSARLGNAANVGVVHICKRLQQPLDELTKLVGIDAAQQNNRESPGAGRGMPSTAKRGSESGRTPHSRESVAQEGRRSNTV